jgi:hypothetical protein
MAYITSKVKNPGDRSQEPGKIIGIVEDWNNGIMGLRAKNILIIASSTVYCIKLVPLDPLFQHSNIPRCSLTGKAIET